MMNELNMMLDNQSKLPPGWKWNDYEDGSGSLRAPDGTSYFSYDRAPYANCGGIEYKREKGVAWDVYWGSMADFKAYAEEFVLNHNMNKMDAVIYEVDIRDRETGNSVETIYSGTNDSEAYKIADEWNKEHGLGMFDKDYVSYDDLVFRISPNYCPEQKYFADVYHVETSRQKPHGVGKYNDETREEDALPDVALRTKGKAR